MAFCRCCFISTIPAAVSPTQSPVMLCAQCGPHYGDPDRTAVAHDRMMTSYRESNARVLERVDERREAAVEELERTREQVRELTATIVSDYSSRPTGDARQVIERAIVADTASREALVAKARDRAMGVLSRVDELHREDGEQCSCGRRITQCPEFAALRPIGDELRRWRDRRARVEGV